jgi:diguanylate cyclase (GGDEF)-like protein
MEKKSIVNITEQMEILRNGYLTRLPLELKELKVLSEGLNGEKKDRISLDEMYHRTHKLAGSGGTFGFSALSAKARSLENQLKLLLENPSDNLDEIACTALVNSVNELAETVHSVEIPIQNLQEINRIQPSDKSVVIWLIEDDEMLGQELVRQLESFNFVVRHFTRIDDAERAAKQEHPDMLIMDVMFEAEGVNSTEVLTLRSNLRKFNCPLMFISTMDDFASRVRATQLGADGYILKPLDVPRLVSRIVQVFEQRRSLPQRVLIVDDDVDLATHYRLVLQSAGLDAEVLHDPKKILEKVSAFRPELILMDMYMPVVSGPELAGVIRQFDKWTSLPIVYLSTETNLNKQIEAMNSGADDFLMKPISDAQLIAAVRVRIERARHLEGQINKDNLTGLLKHASIKEAAELEVIRSRRNGKPVTIAMLDIDYFKRVNDLYGHATGDIVISSIAMLLRQRLRQSDIIGRYGGEEFAVVLPECNSETAFELLDNLRQRFSKLLFSHEGKDFNCTISVGLSCSINFPASNSAQLLVAADEALYVAKREGRNQVRAASAKKTEKGE